MQQPLHQRRRRRVALGTQLPGQRAQRLSGPAQRRHRVSPRFGVDQLVQRSSQTRIQLPGALAAPAGNAGAAHLQRLRVIQLIAATTHRVRGNPHRISNDPDPVWPQLTGLGAKPDPALTLGQMRPDRVVAASQRLPHRAHSTDHKPAAAAN